MSSNNLVNRVSTAATQTLVASGSNEAVVVEPHLPDRHHSSPLSVATSPVGLDDEQQSSRRAAPDDPPILVVFRPTFTPLPLGSIKPLNWLRSSLLAQSHGLAGHQFDSYPYVSESTWIGGGRHYSPLNEAATYWFNGIVPLAYALADDEDAGVDGESQREAQRLKQQINGFVREVARRQQDDGWLGPEGRDEGREIWGRFPLILGMTQLLDADPSYALLLLPAIYRFIDLVKKMLLDGNRGYIGWGRARAYDFILSLQWLLENRSRYAGVSLGSDGHSPNHKSNVALLIDTMELISEHAFDWADFFSESSFPKGDLDAIGWDREYDYVHVVNVGQALKMGAVEWRRTGNDSLRTMAHNAANWTFQYHGSPAGAIIGDERIAGRSPNRGAELCGIVELLFSLHQLHLTFGSSEFADLAERTAYNALPAMISPDAWAHQYVSMSNQPWALPLPVSPSPFFNVDNRGLVFGLEPHFPCCTVNHPQGLPKFLAGSWMITRKSLGKVRMKAGEEWQDELVHGMLGPSHVKTILREMKGGTEILNAVKVRCETAYPFEQVLVYHITAKEPLDISLRIPSWVDLETSSLRVHDRSVGPLSRQHPPQITLVSDTSLRPAPRTRLHALRLPAGYSTFTLTLGAALHIEERNPGMVAVHYGPLLYALDLRPVSHWVPPVEWQSHAELPAWRWMGGGAHDEVVLGTSPWNVAIDLGSLRIGEERKRDGGGAASGDEQFFMPENGPTEIVEITVMACEVEWEVERGVPAPAPVVLQSRAGEGDAGTRQELNREKDCIGPMRRVRFVPFGQAKVRMTELPVVDLGWGGRR